jgi:hypothetical protein
MIPKTLFWTVFWCERFLKLFFGVSFPADDPEKGCSKGINGKAELGFSVGPCGMHIGRLRVSFPAMNGICLEPPHVGYYEF